MQKLERERAKREKRERKQERRAAAAAARETTPELDPNSEDVKEAEPE